MFRSERGPKQSPEQQDPLRNLIEKGKELIGSENLQNLLNRVTRRVVEFLNRHNLGKEDLGKKEAKESQQPSIEEVLENLSSKYPYIVNYYLQAELTGNAVYIPSGYDFLGEYSQFCNELQQNGISLEQFVNWKQKQREELNRKRAEREEINEEILRQQEIENIKNKIEETESEIKEIYDNGIQDQQIKFLFERYNIPVDLSNFDVKKEDISRALNDIESLRKRIESNYLDRFLTLYRGGAYEERKIGSRIELRLKNEKEIQDENMKRELNQVILIENTLDKIDIVLSYLYKLQELMSLKEYLNTLTTT